APRPGHAPPPPAPPRARCSPCRRRTASPRSRRRRARSSPASPAAPGTGPRRPTRPRWEAAFPPPWRDHIAAAVARVRPLVPRADVTRRTPAVTRTTQDCLTIRHMSSPDPAVARALLVRGLGRRAFLRAATALTGAGGAGLLAACSATPVATSPAGGGTASDTPLQPGSGPIDGDHYLQSTLDTVRWGYVPAIGAEPALTIASGETVTIDTVSHEGILEDQGRDPVAYFGGHGVAQDDVLTDAVTIARDYARTPRNFDVDGPHVITGPVFVEGAQPGDVLRVETLSAVPRVPYGVVSSRHGKGALARTSDGGAPAGITVDEVMPPVATDGRAS